MKEEIIKLSKENNIDLIGFANTKKLVFDKEIYIKQKVNNYDCSFQVGDIEDKILSSEKYKKYNTAIVIGISYYKNDMSEEDYVYLSSISTFDDYHVLLRNKFDKIKMYLEDNGYICDVFVDNNQLDERLLAYNAGLGYYGKNNLLINDKYGSYFCIGVLLTNAIIDSDNIINKKCYLCNKCINVCPTLALGDNGFNSNKCLSYLNQKKDIKSEENKYFNNCIYGCDKCIEVCPHNNHVKVIKEKINPYDFLNMSGDDYKKIYKQRSCFWRGKKVLDRNINLYLNNLKKHK